LFPSGVNGLFEPFGERQSVKRIVQPRNTPNGQTARACSDVPGQHQDSRFYAIATALADAFWPWCWDRLASVSEALISFYTRRRREQKVRKAIAVLSELDERMLRDIGVFSRSEIEHIVRSGGED
jgi:uncharacterized protein YjiS (DUF1127 family)